MTPRRTMEVTSSRSTHLLLPIALAALLSFGLIGWVHYDSDVTRVLVGALVILFTLVALVGWWLDRAEIRWVGLLLLVGFVSLLFFGSAIQNRSSGDDNGVGTHDNVLQIEAAADFLLAGKNPYEEEYGAAFGQRWATITTLEGPISNPAIHHVITLPLYFLLVAAGKLLFSLGALAFDVRYLHWALFAVALGLLMRRSLPEHVKGLFLAFFALNPLTFWFLIEGRNDVVIVSLLVFVLLALSRRRYVIGALFLALAAAVKQSVWLIVPFVAVHLFAEYRRAALDRTTLRRAGLVFGGVLVALLVPFFLWAPQAFIDDVYRYPAGGLATSYPINGFGLSALIYVAGSIAHVTDPFPFIWLELIVTAPLLWLLLRRQYRSGTVATIAAHAALFLLVFWFFSRFFHDNYFGFVLQLLLLAWYFGYEPVTARDAPDVPR